MQHQNRFSRNITSCKTDHSQLAKHSPNDHSNERNMHKSKRFPLPPISPKRHKSSTKQQLTRSTNYSCINLQEPKQNHPHHPSGNTETYDCADTVRPRPAMIVIPPFERAAGTGAEFRFVPIISIFIGFPSSCTLLYLFTAATASGFLVNTTSAVPCRSMKPATSANPANDTLQPATSGARHRRPPLHSCRYSHDHISRPTRTPRNACKHTSHHKSQRSPLTASQRNRSNHTIPSTDRSDRS